MLAELVFYLWNQLVRRAGIDSKEQLLRVVLLLMFGVFSMPGYWLLHLWKNEPAARLLPVRGRVRARHVRTSDSS